jgi:serine/threonine protein kinase
MDIFALGVTIAILLTGQEPFTCHSSRAHIDAVNRGVNFNSRPWAYVSPAARNLLRRMLAPEAKDRPTALQCLQSEWIADTNAAVEYVQQALALPVPPSVIPGGTVAMTFDPSKPQPRVSTGHSQPQQASQLASAAATPATTSSNTSPAAAAVVESPVDGGVISGPTAAVDASPYKDSSEYAHTHHHGSSSGRGASVDEPEDVVQSFQQSVRSLRQSRLSQQAHASTHVLVADGASGRVGLRSRDDARAEEVDSEGGTAANSGGSTASSSAAAAAGGGRPPIPLGPQQTGGRTPGGRAPIPLAPQRK